MSIESKVAGKVGLRQLNLDENYLRSYYLNFPSQFSFRFLQLLNICMERRTGLPFSMQSTSTSTMQMEESKLKSDSDDEFFDCDDDKIDEEGKFYE